MVDTIEFFENRCCVCYVPFAQRGRGRMRLTCSGACRQRLYRLRHPQQGQGGQDRRVVLRVRGAQQCAVCGKPLIQPRRGRRRKTCSEACRKRLWRWENPTCLACGRRFKPVRSYQKYCTEACQWRANEERQRRRALERREAKYKGIRPYWMPRQGSGYREEAIPWEAGAKKGRVVRERRRYSMDRTEWEQIWEEEVRAAEAVEGEEGRWQDWDEILSDF